MEAGLHPNPSSVFISLEDVELLLSSPFGTWRLKAPVQLALLDHTPELRRRFEARLNHLALVCGCAEGSIAGATALLLLAVTWLRSGEGLNWARALTTLAIIICTAIVAKVARVMTARVQMRGVLREISRHGLNWLPVTEMEALS